MIDNQRPSSDYIQVFYCARAHRVFLLSITSDGNRLMMCVAVRMHSPQSLIGKLASNFRALAVSQIMFELAEKFLIKSKRQSLETKACPNLLCQVPELVIKAFLLVPSYITPLHIHSFQSIPSNSSPI